MQAQLTVDETASGSYGVFQVDAGVRNVEIFDLTVVAASYASTIANDGGYLDVAGCTISGGGDGIYFDTVTGGSLTVSNCNISNNAYRGIDFYGQGGTASVLTTITGCSISNNSGSGLYTYESATNLITSVQGCTISGNSGDGIFSAGTLTVSDSTISGNGECGILDLDDAGNVALSNCTVWGNSGGGISNGEPLTLDNCTVSQNTTSSSGGGIYNNGFWGTMLLNNTIVANNSSSSGPDIAGSVTANYSSSGTRPGRRFLPRPPIK